MISAVASRTSLTSSSKVGTGLTFMAMVAPPYDFPCRQKS